MKNSLIIMKKELFRVFGDKKTVFGVFILPAVLVIVLYSVIGNLVTGMQSDIEEHTARVYVVDAPESLKNIAEVTDYYDMAEVTYLSSSEYSGKEADLKDKILNGGADLIVIFEKDFENTALTPVGTMYGVPNVKICYNPTENYSAQAFSVFRQLVLENYRSQLLAVRLGDLSVLTVFSESDEVIAKEEKVNSQFLSMMLPYMIIIMLFSSAMGLSVDAFAGEKERGTLSSMLLSPVHRSEIVEGKILALSIMAALSAVIYAGSLIIAFSVGGEAIMGEAIGSMSEAHFSVVQILELFATMIIMEYLFVVLISFLSILAKDMKTASAIISPIQIGVILIGLVTMFTIGSDIPLTRYAIPIYGNALCISAICSNELTLAELGLSLIGVVVISVIMTIGITKAFNSEKVMFNA